MRDEYEYDLGEPSRARRSSSSSDAAWFFWLLAGAFGGYWLHSRIAEARPAEPQTASEGDSGLSPSTKEWLARVKASDSVIDMGPIKQVAATATPSGQPIEFDQASNYWFDQRVHTSQPHREPAGTEFEDLYPYPADKLDLDVDDGADFGMSQSVAQPDRTVRGYLTFSK